MIWRKVPIAQDSTRKRIVFSRLSFPVMHIRAISFAGILGVVTLSTDLLVSASDCSPGEISQGWNANAYEVTALLTQPDGRLVVASDSGLVRLLEDGTLDLEFRAFSV